MVLYATKITCSTSPCFRAFSNMMTSLDAHAHRETKTCGASLTKNSLIPIKAALTVIHILKLSREIILENQYWFNLTVDKNYSIRTTHTSNTKAGIHNFPAVTLESILTQLHSQRCRNSRDPAEWKQTTRLCCDHKAWLDALSCVANSTVTHLCLGVKFQC